jgi:hypothetical protein
MHHASLHFGMSLARACSSALPQIGPGRRGAQDKEGLEYGIPALRHELLARSLCHRLTGSVGCADRHRCCARWCQVRSGLFRRGVGERLCHRLTESIGCADGRGSVSREVAY